MNNTLLCSALCLCLLCSACKNQEPAASAPTEKPTAPISAPVATKENTQTLTPEPEEKVPSATQAAQTEVLKGKVAETMNSGGYTYLLLDTGSAKQWVAIPETPLTVGEEVTCQGGMVMPQFTSKTLNRTFDSIIFSAGLAGKTAPAADPHAGLAKADPHAGLSMPNPHGTPAEPAKDAGADSFASAVKAEKPASAPATNLESGGSIGAMAPFADIKVEKAAGENGHTVAEIFAGNTALDGKTVRVQGKVVKFSPMIMGKNWLHLQDGSGDPINNTHDLVVTTTAQPPKDQEIITVEGVVRANKDFGAGYSYVVIIEEATIVQ